MKLGNFENFRKALVKELSYDRTDWNKQRYTIRELEGNDPDEPRLQAMIEKYPALSRTRDAIKSSSHGKEIRDRMDMGIDNESYMGRAGQMLGTATSDILQDGARSFWWLMNAPQAVSNVIAEGAYGAVAPELYRAKKTTNRFGVDYDMRETASQKRALEDGIAFDAGDGEVRLKAGYFTRNSKIHERTFPGGHVAALLFPQGLAINSGLGLMTPFGGYEGYEAVLPDPEDKSKTTNVLGEVATKYFLGRTGNLLPYNEFKKVRPDVSYDEYQRYKAFKFDKKTDLDGSDGKLTLPFGILKGTTEGIHGPEVQFLGRSLPVTTAIVPFAASLAGGVGGAYIPTNRKRFGNRLVNMMAGTMTGTTVGMVGGELLEKERQRRNAAANQLAAQKDELGF